MEVKGWSDSNACRKRKLETISEEWARKLVKPGSQSSEPKRPCPHLCLKWLFKVLMKPNPSIRERSRTPLQFLYLKKGQWEVYAGDVAAALSVSFASGQHTARFLVAGRMYVVDFARMVQLNLQTGYLCSVAWIDDAGKCFAPARCFEGGILSLLQQTSQQLLGGCGKLETSSESIKFLPTDFSLLRNRISALTNDEQQFTVIKEKFINGLGPLAKHTCVVSIHRCSFEGTSAQVRLETFQRQEQAVGAARGYANVRYAWHGTSKKGVLGIILHGFGQPIVPNHGANYGSGIYLAPEGSSLLSAIYSDIDEDGVQHMLLCKVILGEMEQVLEGSKQFFPSSEEYDTGVDDVASPSRYIVWTTHMNTYILPQFVVGFKLAPPLCEKEEYAPRSRCLSCRQPSSPVQGRGEARILKKSFDDVVNQASQNGVEDDSATLIGLHMAPQSPWISFPDLFFIIGKNLSPCALMTLQQLHRDFQVGRLSRKSLIKSIRAVAGDVVLWECIMGKKLGSNSGFSGCGEGDNGA